MSRLVNTDNQVKALRPGAKPYRVKVKDSPSTFVKVTPAGARVFVLAARQPGKVHPGDIIIGDAADHTINEARDLASAMRKRLSQGLPAKDSAPKVPDTVKELAAVYKERHIERNGLRSKSELERMLDKIVVPAWGERRLADIRRSDVVALLDSVEDKRGPVAADRLLALVRHLMTWYAARTDNYVSPIIRGMARTKPAERRRERILSDDEIRLVWEAAGNVGAYGIGVRLGLVTGQRRHKVFTMRWADVDADGVWTIPTEEREKGNAERLKLPKHALDVIRDAPRFDGSPYVMPGHNRHFNGYGKGKSALDCEIVRLVAGLSEDEFKALKPKERAVLPCPAPWVYHDLRRTARSLLARAGVSREIAERTLGHIIPGVEGTYDRHAYDDEKANALERLAALLERILNPEDNVVPIRDAVL